MARQVVVFRTRAGGHVAKYYKSPASAARAKRGLRKIGWKVQAVSGHSLSVRKHRRA